MTNTKYKCSTKGCKAEPCLKLLGKWLCWKCWEKHCDKEGTWDEGVSRPTPCDGVGGLSFPPHTTLYPWIGGK